ncbi:MAG TPA: hypothetical protein VFN48_11385, partial [Solirubrobacteraceae bacterium]|nr:hypothetical protein [Solirubrobacteraceae bacterium]
MAMVIGSLIVLVGVVIGWWTLSGSGIHARAYRDRNAGGEDRQFGDSPLDSPWTMDQWSRGTAS